MQSHGQGPKPYPSKAVGNLARLARLGRLQRAEDCVNQGQKVFGLVRPRADQIEILRPAGGC